MTSALAAFAPARVVRREHLLQVLRVERLPRLDDLARRLQPQLLESGAGVVLPEEPEEKDPGDQATEQHECERIHRRRSLLRRPLRAAQLL